MIRLKVSMDKNVPHINAKVSGLTSFVSWERLVEEATKNMGFENERIVTVIVKDSGINFVWENTKTK